MFGSKTEKKKSSVKNKKAKNGNNSVENEEPLSDDSPSHQAAAPTVPLNTQNKNKKNLKKTTVGERKNSENSEESDKDEKNYRDPKKKSKKVSKNDSDEEIKAQKSSKNNKLSKFVKKDFKFSAVEITPLEVLKFEPSNKEYVRWFAKGREVERILLAVSFALFEEFKGKYNQKFSSSPPHEVLSTILNLAENGLPNRKLPVEIIELIDLIKTQYIFDIIENYEKYKDYIGCLLLNIIKKKCKIKIKSSQDSIEDNEWKGIANGIRADIVIKGILHKTEERKAFDNTFEFIIEDSKVGIRYVNEQAKITGPLYNELEMKELNKELNKELKCKEEKINKQQEYIKVCEDFIEKVTSNLEESEKIKNIFKRRNNCEVRVLERLTKEAKDCFKSASNEYKEVLQEKKIKNCSSCGREGTGFKLECQDFTHIRCVRK